MKFTKGGIYNYREQELRYIMMSINYWHFEDTKTNKFVKISSLTIDEVKPKE